MKYPAGSEYRAGLSDVLDDVHRRTIAKAMARVGIDIGKGTWDDLTRYGDELTERDPEKAPQTIVYNGSHTFGPIFGKPHHLVESHPTDYIVAKSSHLHFIRGWMEIDIQDKTTPPLTEPSRIFLLPDIAPVAVHGRDYEYIIRHYPRTSLNDTFIINAIRKNFGQEALEFLSEDVAQEVVYALTHDATKISDVF